MMMILRHLPNVHVAFDGDPDVLVPLNGDAPELYLYYYYAVSLVLIESYIIINTLGALH